MHWRRRSDGWQRSDGALLRTNTAEPHHWHLYRHEPQEFEDLDRFFVAALPARFDWGKGGTPAEPPLAWATAQLAA